LRLAAIAVRFDRAESNETTRILFVVLLVFVLAVAYRVIAPFLSGLIWAAVLVAAFNPLRNRIERLFGGRPKAAPAVVAVMLAAFVAVPILVAAVSGLVTSICRQCCSPGSRSSCNSPARRVRPGSAARSG
jgi:predicted PurR-regulated permease PerM